MSNEIYLGELDVRRLQELTERVESLTDMLDKTNQALMQLSGNVLKFMEITTKELGKIDNER